MMLRGLPVQWIAGGVAAAIILAASAAVLTGQVRVGGPPGAITVGTGFTILSMDKPPVVTGNEDLAKLNYNINLVLGGGRSLVGTLDPAETAALGGSPTISTKFPLTISAEAGEEVVTYPLRVQNNPVNVFRHDAPVCAFNTDSSCVAFLGDFSALRLCPAAAPTYRILPEKPRSGFLGSWWTIYCVNEVPAAIVAGVDNPTIRPSSKWVLTAQGERIEATAGHDAATGRYSTIAEFRSPTKGLLATLNCPGGLFTGDTWTAPHLFRGVWVKSLSTWHIIEAADYDNAKTTLDQYRSNLITFNTNGKTTGEVTFYPGLLSTSSAASTSFTKLVSVEREIVPGKSVGVSGGESNGVATYRGNANILAQQCSLNVRADWLGVVVNVGKPEITAFTMASSNLGDPASGSVTVKNIGAAAGTFQITLACQGGMRQSFLARQPTLQPGGQETVIISLNTVSVGSATCTARACDVNSPSVCSKDVTATATVGEPRACQEGETKPSGQSVWRCENGRWNTNFKVCGGDTWPSTPDGTTWTCTQTVSKEAVAAAEAAGAAAAAAGEPLTVPPSGFIRKPGPDYLLLALIIGGVLGGVGIVAYLVVGRRPRM